MRAEQMNGIAEAIIPVGGNVLPIRSGQPEQDSVPFTWIQQRLWELGIVSKINEPTRPPGFFFNYTTAAFYIVVIGAIASGFWFTWTQADKAGFDRGKQEAVQQEMQKQIDIQSAEIKKQNDMLRLVIGPEPEQKEKK